MARRLLILAALAFAPSVWAAGRPGESASTLDRELQQRAQAPRGHSRVILRVAPGTDAESVIRGAHGTLGRRLASVAGQIADVPDAALDALSRLPGVEGISLDRRVEGTLERTGATIGATYVREALGLDGAGVGVAIIDSGVANWHDDLGADRVMRFVDFVNFESAPYDDYGHGTHVAGIIAGSGYDSGGRRRGIAPGATLLVEKVLDADGQGYISNVISAIDYAIANKDALHLRVINLSVAAGIYESFTTDPLTLAAKRAVDAGLVVVSAAGNLGRNALGEPQAGGIGAPGNAPWVITVGASSHMGTIDRSDDTVAAFSSRGPTVIDVQAKPDLVAPGVGIESLAEAGSTLYNTKPMMRLWGTVQTATEPYISLSGTSMASPVVSGTIALMLQANPSLTPNLVKAILEFTAETHAEYTDLVQGAGFLNARGAVELAQKIAGGTSTLDSNIPQDDPTPWGRHVIWANQLVGGDLLAAVALGTDTAWGATAVGPSTDGGESILWGTDCASVACDNVVWSTNALDNVDDVLWSPVKRNPQFPATNSQGEDLGVTEFGTEGDQSAERRR